MTPYTSKNAAISMAIHSLMTLYVYAECCNLVVYGGCCYAECCRIINGHNVTQHNYIQHYGKNATYSITLSVAMKPFKPSVLILCVLMVRVVMLDGIMRSVTMLNFIILSVVMLNVTMLSVVMLIVFASKMCPRMTKFVFKIV
jgi:hypothetical protein